MAISLDEALGMSLADEADESIHVDVNTRQITIPESQKLFGVESDADVEIKHIVIDGRYADGNRDLSKLAWRVVYRNAKKGSGYYLIPSVVANKNSIEMDWLIKRSVVVYKGTVDFILCAFATTSSGEVTPEWNSTLGQGIVLKGLETSAIDIGKESVDELSKILYETVKAKDAAVSAASNATANAENAAGSKAAAASSASAAAESEQAAADGSALNAENAQKSALNAQQSANNAAESQSAAKANADAAAGSANAAGNSASAASRSEQAAGASEVKAAASAKKAKDIADSLPEDYTTAVNEIAALKTNKADKTELETVNQQVANITPDDSSIGDKPWSSKHIIDMLCPPLEESGNPVVCYPVAGYALGVKASWEPVQEGSGTPYPAGGGKQLLDTNKCVPTVGKPYSMTITLDGDVFKVSGVPNEEVTATEFYSFAVCTCSQEELRGKGYKVTAWAIKGKVNRAWGLRTESENSLAIAAELTPGVNNDIQLRLMVSKDTPTAWEPYENIRPIKGRDSVRVERCGENLLNIKPFNKDTYKGITYEYVPDGGIHVSGTALTSVDSPTFPVWLLPPGKYFGLELGSGISASIVVQRNGKNLWLNAKGAFEILAGDVTKYWYAIVSAGATVDKTVYPYIVPGTTTPTTYTPYIGQTNTLTLPDTVYGGEVDAVTGDGNNNTKVITLDGNELKFSQSSIYFNLPMHSAPGILARGIICCSHFDSKRFGVNTNYEFCFMLASDIADLFANVDDLNAYLAAQYAAGTPVQLAYKLAKPVPFTATGSQPIHALAGANTILIDADSATVTGRADPIKRITDLEDAVASQT